MTLASTIACLLVVAASAGPKNEPAPAVLLDQYAPCGQTSLYLVCRIRGVEADFSRIEQLTGPADDEGCHSFADLSAAAEQLGLRPLGVRVDRERLIRLPMPAIVHTKNPQGEPRPHLSVALSATPEGVYLLDPPYEARLVPWSLFEYFWTGNLLVFPESDEQAAEIESRLHSAGSFQALTWTLRAELAALVAIVAVAAVPLVRRSRGKSPAEVGAPRTTAQHAVVSKANWIVRRLRLRKVWIPAAGLLAVAVVGVGTIWLVPAIRESFSDAPRLLIEQPLVDLGELAPDQHEATVTLRNTGRSPLVISRVESSCSCAVVTKPEQIEPGATADLKVNIRVAPGKGYANLVLQTDDPRGPQDVTLSWYGSAKPLLVPRWVEAHDVPLDAPYEHTVSIVYPGGRAAIVPVFKGVSCPEKSVHIDAVGNDPTAFRTASDVSEHSALGYLNLRLTVAPPERPAEVKTDCLLSVQYGQHAYDLKLPILVRFVGAIRAQPEGVVFAARESAALKGQTRTIALAGDAPLGPLQVQESPQWLRCALEESAGPDSLQELRMEVVEPPPESLEGAKVVISAQDGKAQAAIDVRTFVQRGG